MNQKTWEEVLSLCDEVETLLTQAAPVADPNRLRRIQFLAACVCGHDSYATRAANRLSSLAAIYLSAQRHRAEARGADGVMHEMRYSLLKAIRETAQHRLKEEGRG
jgi:hypothetical protein